MGRWMGSLLWSLFLVGLLAALARWTGLDAVVRDGMAGWRMLDVILGALAFVWLLTLLKAPWDLYFEAHAVAFEQQRSHERGIPVPADRRAYVTVLRQRLLWVAIGAHAFSAALTALVTYFTHGTVGYWFALFYLVSTLFRPSVAGYVYLRERLRTLRSEAHYPREDVGDLLTRLDVAEQTIRRLDEALAEHRTVSHQALVELRQNQDALGREFESAIGRLTDNQEVISGIQAFVRLISQSAVRAG